MPATSSLRERHLRRSACHSSRRYARGGTFLILGALLGLAPIACESGGNEAPLPNPGPGVTVNPYRPDPPRIVRPVPTDREDSLPVLGGVHPEGPWNPAEELPEGDNSFFRLPGAGTTSTQGGNTGGSRGFDDDADADGLAAGEAAEPGGAAPPSNGSAPSEPRLIEEADIVKVVGDYLFVLNQWRGLQIIDMQAPDQPVMVARVPLTGRPVEMYVKDGNAYVLVSDYFSWWRYEGDSEDLPYYGSQLAVIDVSEPTQPEWVSGFNLDGFVSDTRIVGDVLYAVSNRYSWWGSPGWGSGDYEDATVVVSINMADPGQVFEVDRLELPRQGHQHHLNVTEDAILIAAGGWSYDDSLTGLGESEIIRGAYTALTYVDISDPAGEIREAESFIVPGFLQDRWAFDLHGDALRIVTAPNRWWATGGALRTYRVPAPDWTADTTQPLEHLASVTLPQRDSLTAARFDGERGYVLTYERPVRVDPLLTVDLSEPTDPRVLGELHMPGWIDYAEPRGDRLVTLGRDDDGRTLTVGLYDVGDMHNPTELSRLSFGGRWASTPGHVDRDDFQKVFKVLDELGLIMVPYQAWEQDEDRYYGYRFVGAVQLVDYSPDELKLRGRVDGAGRVQRALPYEDRVVTISDTTLQVVDIEDRDTPALTARLDLSRNAARVAFIDDWSVQLVPPDWYRGNGRLVVTPADEPDTPSPIAELELDGYPGTLLSTQRGLFVVETPRERDAVPTLVSIGVDSDGVPARRGSVEVPMSRGHYGYYGWWSFVDYEFERYPYWYGGMARALAAGDDIIVLVGTHYGRWPVDENDEPIACLDCADDEHFDAEDPALAINRWWNQVQVVDVSDPAAPQVASRFTLRHARFPYGLKTRGARLLFSVEREEEIEGRRALRSWLHAIDLSAPDAPVYEAPVNIPGHFVDISDGGRYLFTAETDTRGFTPRTTLFTSALLNGHAYLRGESRVDGIAQGAVVRGAVAFLPAGISRGWFDGASGQRRQQQNAMILNMVDLREVRQPELTGELMFVTGTRAARLVAVAQGRAIFQVGVDQLVIYDVSNQQAPQIWDSLRSGGYIQQVSVHDGSAFVSAGPYGIHRVDLAPLSADTPEN